MSFVLRKKCRIVGRGEFLARRHIYITHGRSHLCVESGWSRRNLCNLWSGQLARREVGRATKRLGDMDCKSFIGSLVPARSASVSRGSETRLPARPADLTSNIVRNIDGVLSLILF